MIDIRKLKELVRLMVENDLSELDLQDQQETVTIKRGGSAAPVARVGAAAGAIAGEVGSDDGKPEVEAPAAATAGAAPAPAAQASTTGLIPIVSPMVGTAYLTPNPDSPSFVQVGASIGPESTVCLIEAMKVFSEIKAETSGVIERVLVTNGQAVQYGQQLFLVRPA